jgi:hypothetical protein
MTKAKQNNTNLKTNFEVVSLIKKDDYFEMV